MTFGERLKKLRQEKEVTQVEIGELLGVGRRMVSFYESNKHFPSDAESLIKLSAYFNVSLDYLLGTSDIRNYDDMLKSFNIYKVLPPEGMKEADEYMRFLVQKYKLKPSK